MNLLVVGPMLVTVAGAMLVTVAGAMLVTGRTRAVARRRLAAHQCVRCGTPTSDPIDLTREELHPTFPLLVCVACAARTRRNHRLVYQTFMGLLATGVLAMIVGVRRDLRNGTQYSVADVGVVLIYVFALSSGVVWARRRMARLKGGHHA